MARADLHVHSKYSNRPNEWFLRRIGAPQSFVEPRALYDTCRQRGMSFITITDHNSISGALDIADLPGTFLSSEITTYFPDDGCKIHCLVYGLTETWFREIQEVRENIFDLHLYLNDKGIAHSIAHPLFQNNGKLTIRHVEQLLLMFKTFEVLNGSHDQRAAQLAMAVFAQLTPDHIMRLANRYDMIPTGREPWKKFLTGGSDDHSGLYIADAYTETESAPTVVDFLQHLREGRHTTGGRAGSSLRLARSLYHIAYTYYRSRFVRQTGDSGLVGKFLAHLTGDGTSGLDRVPAFISRLIIERRMRKLNDIERIVVDELMAIEKRNRAGNPPGSPPQSQDAQDQMNFRTACQLGHQLTFAFLNRFFEQLKNGGVIESLQSLSSLGPVFLGITPYLTAFRSQHKDETFLRTVADHFPDIQQKPLRSGRRAWFTDTLTDCNGVSLTIRQLARESQQADQSITVITCQHQTPSGDFQLKNFAPVGTFPLPEYESQTLVFPPFLEIFEYIEKEQFDSIIVSTPGPMGLVARAAAHLFQIPIRGIYHTDFPQYIQHLTDDEALTEATWRYMIWFYRDMEKIYAPSSAYVDQLVSHGIDRARVSILTRGVDGSLFNPERRNPHFWEPWGLNGAFKFLYVGRVSKEKNLDVLLHAFRRVHDQAPDAELIVVGEGPHLAELKAAAADLPVTFTGYLQSTQLAGAYANANLFVFPSTTDTFGNAILEAHASGLPAVVSTEGGPAEIVASHGSGIAINMRSEHDLANAMLQLKQDSSRLTDMRQRALTRAKESIWSLAYQQL